MASTLLTEPPKKKHIEQEKARQHSYEIAEILCAAILQSREESSISTSRATKEIVAITSAAIENELFSEQRGERLAGKYILAVSRCTSIEGRSNGKPSGLVKLVQESHPYLNIKLGYRTAENKDKKGTAFAKQSKLLAEYGLDIKPGTIKDWISDKAQKI